MKLQAILRQLSPCDIVAAGLCFAILAHAVSVTRGVSWPADPDQFRDLAQAQTMLEGWWLGDPYYRGETLWYNPLAAAVLAALSALTGAEPRVVQVSAGPFLNLLAPIAIYLFMAIAVSRSAALLGLVAFVCFDDSLAYISASYSPWMFPATIAQGLFFAALAVLVYRHERGAPLSMVLAGSLLGVLLLAHLAPAVALGGAIAAVVFWNYDRRQLFRALTRLAIAVAVAVVVASPLLWSIVIRYGLHIVHPHPTIWQEEMLKLERFGFFVRDHFGRGMMIMVALGSITVLRNQAKFGPRLIAGWTLAAIASLAYSYLWQWMNAMGIAAPAILPGFHFLRYVKLAEVVLFGCGAAVAFDAIARRVHRSRPDITERAARQMLTVVASLAIIINSYPLYVARRDATEVRAQSLRMFSGPDQRELYDWIRAQPERHVIYAAPNSIGMSIIGPAGGRLLVTDPFFSNPHVDWQSRNGARNELIRALATEDCGAARTIARQFDVTFVVADRRTIASYGPCGLGPVFDGSVLRVFRLPQWFLSEPNTP